MLFRIYAFISFWVVLSLSAHAFQIEYTSRKHGKILVSFPDYVDTKTTSFTLCTEDPRFEIRTARLWMKMHGGHEHGTTPLTWRNSDKGCYSFAKANFVMAGQWLIQIQSTAEALSLPIWVSSQKIALRHQEEVTTLLLPTYSTRQQGMWLLCGQNEIARLRLEHHQTRELIESDVLETYGHDCQTFKKLPLPRTGHWHYVIELQNGQEQKGYIDVDR